MEWRAGRGPASGPARLLARAVVVVVLSAGSLVLAAPLAGAAATARPANAVSGSPVAAAPAFRADRPPAHRVVPDLAEVWAREAPARTQGPASRRGAEPSVRAGSAEPQQIETPCTFNGVNADEENTLDVTPGEQVQVQCSSFYPYEQVALVEGSPLFEQSGDGDDLDLNDSPVVSTDQYGDVGTTFTIPDPFSASDGAAVCPPSANEVEQGEVQCFIVVADQYGDGNLMWLDYPAPNQPSVSYATAGNGSATVNFEPESDPTILHYGAIAENLTDPGQTVQSAPSSGSPITVDDLINGDRYALTVTAVNYSGDSEASTPSNTVIPNASPPAPQAAPYVPLAPDRISDTRNLSRGPLLGGQVLNLTVAGTDGVPEGATSVVVNVTVTSSTGASYLAVYPSGQPPPPTSSLNFAAGQTVANLVEVGLSPAGQISLFNWGGSTQVVVDLEGYSAPGTAGSAYHPLTPTRVLDTRPPPSGPIGIPTPRLVGAAALTLTMAGAGGVPKSGASAVVLNVTATGSDASSWLTVWPAGSAMPLASNLNFTPGQSVPNRVIVPLGAGGAIDFANGVGTTNVVADVTGYFSTKAAGLEFEAAATPVPLVDTRPCAASCNPYAGRNLVAGTPLAVVGAGVMSIPAGAKALAANLVVVDPTASGWATVWPDTTQTPPLASDVNFGPGEVADNMDLIDLAGAGPGAHRFNIEVAPSGVQANVIVDVDGWYLAPAK